jgi:hypothetical protein
MYNNRNFSKIINEKKYKIGIEVGVREGWHCLELLGNSNLDKLYGVDIIKQESVNDVYNKFGQRFEFINKSSIEASKDFKDKFFNFIYVDADHAYESVKSDLFHWWPKLKPGGCLAGDDYMDFDCPGECRFGVIKAVEEFASQNNLIVHIMGMEFAGKQERIEFGNLQGYELNKKIAGLNHNFLFNPQWYIFK